MATMRLWLTGAETRKEERMRGLQLGFFIGFVVSSLARMHGIYRFERKKGWEKRLERHARRT